MAASGPAQGARQAAVPDEPDAARARLASALRDSGRAPSPAVQAAFRAVPRHLFLPEVSPAAAYLDEAFVIKIGADGIPVSSSSQPAMMAIMLEQLGLAPGHQVLEVGTGTGYNAAVMAQITGESGSVATMDIDGELVQRARASLAAAGYGRVIVRRGDGGYGDPDHAPYDRIIVTAGAWDISPAWLNQLAPGGRLVLPLSVRGIQLSVALERPAGYWIATSACRCGFVRMAGAFAGPESFSPLGPPGLYVQVDDGRSVGTAALAAVLAGPAADVPAGLHVPQPGQLGDLDLWLALAEPGLSRVALMDLSADQARAALLPFGGLVSRASPAAQFGVAGLVPARPDAAQSAQADTGQSAVAIRGYGPAGPPLAAHLAAMARRWDIIGRPGVADLSLTVSPAGSPLPADPGRVLLTRPYVRILAGWTDG